MSQTHGMTMPVESPDQHEAELEQMASGVLLHFGEPFTRIRGFEGIAEQQLDIKTRKASQRPQCSESDI